jgi:hypothetical protein
MPLPQLFPADASAWLMAVAVEVAVAGLVSCCLISVGFVGGGVGGVGGLGLGTGLASGVLCVMTVPPGLGLALGDGDGLQQRQQAAEAQV